MEKETSRERERSGKMEKEIEASVGKETSSEEAVGLLEVFGLTCAFLAADAGCKAADVRLETFDKNKPANADSLPVPLLVTVKFRGSVAAVEEAGEAVAKTVTGVVQKHIIPRPTGDTEKMLKISALDKN
jgi:microcompartment protein CcmL/EutN